MSPGHFSLVTPGGTAGPWLLDFESHIYYRLKPLEDGAFRWDKQQREGRFVQGKDGKTAELRWHMNSK
jgi:hypothetical protein